MTPSLGERLAALEQGDSVVVVVDGEQYTGRVARTTRHKCELVDGFMESGSASAELELDERIQERRAVETAHILLRATETAPRSWDAVEAVASDTATDVAGDRIGTVTELTEQ